MDLEDFFSENLPAEILKKFYFTQKFRLNNVIKYETLSKSKKLENLYKKKYKEDYTVNLINANNGWFENLTGKEIPQEVISVVSLGDKFSIDKKISKQDKIELIKCLETKIYNVDKDDEEKQAEIQTEIHQNLTNNI